MSAVTELEISRAWVDRPPAEGETSVDLHRGGPATLLGWLSTQLGLPAGGRSPLERQADLLRVLHDSGTTPPPVFAASLARDPWATVADLVARHGELRLAGWDGRSSPALPELVNQLAAAGDAADLAADDQVVRLEAVEQCLGDGQLLPPHRCTLMERRQRWPRRWQQLLEHLDVVEEPMPQPAAPIGSALGMAQGQLLDAGLGPLEADDSLRVVAARSSPAACETVASALAASPECLAATTICCPEPATLTGLDAALARHGLPTGGAGLASGAHPALQLLPLALRLCWDPVDPLDLLELLLLPVSPIPRPAAVRLAAALHEGVGLGSSAWEAARDRACSPERDPEGTVSGRLAEWVEAPRVQAGMPLASSAVVERCHRVAAFSGSRAANVPPVAASALRVAADQATALATLVEDRADGLHEPELRRLLDAVSAGGVTVEPHPAEASGPRLVTSLVDVPIGCDHLIWLGLDCPRLPRSRWTAAELDTLGSAGLDIDDGSRALAATRRAERRGLVAVARSLVAVDLPRAQEASAHPSWLRIQAALNRSGSGPAPVLERALGAGDAAPLSPWRPAIAGTRIVRALPSATWCLGNTEIADRPTTSASALVTRLACPLKWVLRYPASIKPGLATPLPADDLLAGRFAHRVLEEVFNQEGEVPDADRAEHEAARVFDLLLPREAAPLAAPGRAPECRVLRSQVLTAARVLAEVLSAGSYRVVGMEAELEGSVDDRTLLGRIDCLAARHDGAEAVIDVKYGGAGTYQELLEQGRAVQLAVYAEARRQTTGRWPNVAYLILRHSRLLTPEGGSVAGARPVSRVPGPGMDEVWQRFASALAGAESWTAVGQAIPVRPLQARNDRPEGAELVIDAPRGGKSQAQVSPCSFCDFRALCGVGEVGP